MQINESFFNTLNKVYFPLLLQTYLHTDLEYWKCQSRCLYIITKQAEYNDLLCKLSLPLISLTKRLRVWNLYI